MLLLLPLWLLMLPLHRRIHHTCTLQTTGRGEWARVAVRADAGLSLVAYRCNNLQHTHHKDTTHKHTQEASTRVSEPVCIPGCRLAHLLALVERCGISTPTSCCLWPGQRSASKGLFQTSTHPTGLLMAPSLAYRRTSRRCVWGSAVRASHPYFFAGKHPGVRSCQSDRRVE